MSSDMTDMSCVDVKITTKAWGYENSWSLGSCVSSQRYTNHGLFTQRCCASAGDHTLSCKDSYGDGWHGGFLEIGGKRYCEDFRSGYVKTTTISIGKPIANIKYC